MHRDNLYALPPAVLEAMKEALETYEADLVIDSKDNQKLTHELNQLRFDIAEVTTALKYTQA